MRHIIAMLESFEPFDILPVSPDDQIVDIVCPHDIVYSVFHFGNERSVDVLSDIDVKRVFSVYYVHCYNHRSYDNKKDRAFSTFST